MVALETACWFESSLGHNIGLVSKFFFRAERVEIRRILTADKLPIIFFSIVQKLSVSSALFFLSEITHTFNSVSSEWDISHEANQFAAEFLMPAKYIKDDFKRGITILYRES